MNIATMFFFLTISTICLALAAPQPASVDQLLGPYFSIHKSLSADSVNGVAQSATEIAKISRQAAAIRHENKTQLASIADAAAKLNASDLKSARAGFGDLSEKLIAYVKASGAKTNPPYQFHCPMLNKDWLQADKATKNPFYGSEMPKCGDLVQADKPAEQPANQQMDMPIGHHH